MVLFLLLACHKMRDRVDGLEAVQADQGDDVSALEREVDNGQDADGARLDAAEARLDAAEATILALADRVGETEAELDDALARIAALEELPARVDALEGRMAALEDRVSSVEADLLAVDVELALLGTSVDDLYLLVDDLDERVSSATSGSLEHPAAIYSTSDGSGVATSSAWASVTSSGLTFDVVSGDTILAWCVAVDGTGYAAYRLRGTSADGTWSDSSEALGDGTTTMAYTGEALTVIGTFQPGLDGAVELACEGQWASPSDVTLIAMVL